jgi:hypothetical protein
MILRFAVICIFLQTLSALALPTGEFLVGESEGDDFHHILHLEADQATFTDFTGKDKSSAHKVLFTVSPVSPELYLLEGNDKGEAVRAYLHFTSEDEALIWISGQTDLFWALRTVSADLSSLQGRWSVLAKQDIWEAEINDGRFELLRDGGTSGWSLHPVANPTGKIRVVARPDQDSGVDRDDSYLLYFVPLGPDFWLVRQHEEDHFLMLFRENSRPTMEAELKRRRENSENSEDEED